MSLTYRGYTAQQIAAFIDHTVLKPEAVRDEIVRACEVAAKAKTASLCIRPMDVRLAVELLAGTGVPVCTVVGFPHGSTTTATKVFETIEAVEAGCLEVDMVLNISQLRDGFFDAVQSDIAAVVDAAKGVNPDAIVKVIFETSLLNREQIIKACQLSEAAGADFVKTSTGFSSAGATIENVALMRECVGDRLKVKASGGVRTLDALIDFVEAGADRCGASATESILEDFTSKAPLD
ncbi:MAG: deoxyribose-phosphate aldolase [Micrococcales bacterium]